MSRNEVDDTTKMSGEEVAGSAMSFEEGHLAVLEGPDRGRRFTLRAPGAQIGASRDNDIVLGDDAISKQHLFLELTPQGVLLKDLGSTNGTFLDRVRVQSAFVPPGGRIRAGHTVLVLESSSGPIQAQVSTREEFGGMLGKSNRMRQVFGLLEMVAPTDSTVLILGETGTGKEVVARAVHAESRRSARPFVVFDCSAVSGELIESTLFGHQEGAFTGASSRRKGTFLTADGGTVFIDEIGELPSELQPKLLRVLERREVQPLGSDRAIDCDVRVLAATHRNLRAMVREGTFRQDLFYRLSVIEVPLPALRERPEDIPLLVNYFVSLLGGAGRVVTPAAMTALALHRWEGNVRELKNVIERALVFAGNAPLSPAHFAFDCGSGGGPPAASDLLSGRKTLEEVEIEVLRATLERTGWNKSETARILGISRRALLDKIARHGIRRS